MKTLEKELIVAAKIWYAARVLDYMTYESPKDRFLMRAVRKLLKKEKSSKRGKVGRK